MKPWTRPRTSLLDRPGTLVGLLQRWWRWLREGSDQPDYVSKDVRDRVTTGRLGERREDD